MLPCRYHNQHKIHPFCLAMTISILGTAMPAALAQQLQSDQRQMNIVPLNLYAPIQVTTVFDGGKAFPVPRGPHQSVTFQDPSPDWIGNVTFAVENHSQKDIVAIEAMVFVPPWEDDAKRPHKIVRFHEGQLPDHALFLGDGKRIPEESLLNFTIKPTASVTVSLKQGLDKLRHSFPSPPVPLASVDSVSIQIERIFFADGTVWAHNAYLKPDDSRLGSYVRIAPENPNP